MESITGIRKRLLHLSPRPQARRAAQRTGLAHAPGAAAALRVQARAGERGLPADVLPAGGERPLSTLTFADEPTV